DPNHIFTGLDPDTYDVEVLSYDGECVDRQTVTVDDPALFTASAILVRDLQCNPNYQPNINLNDPDSPEYDPTAPPFDPDEFIALIEVVVTGGSGNFDYSINNPTFQLLSPEPPTTNVFRFTTAGTYIITVTDQDTSCFVETNPVVVNPYTPIEFTIAGTNPVCPTDLGSILVTVTAGQGPYTYDLDRGTQIITSNNSTQTFSGVSNGTHFITVSDLFGCPAEEQSLDIMNTNSITADIAITDELRCDSNGLPFIPGEITISNPQNGNGTYEYSID
ncbi:hypothetical protein, partial [Aquimarina sp. RZ0]|uniref:hypothetical protein n=1 Tax=Aquimarina sp. RZ0 TaxID=2607730 RepID=UPI0011F11E1C